MYFDALTLAAVHDELLDTLVGGRIQAVRMPSALSLALEIYQPGRRYHLLLSAHPQFTRAHLTSSRPSRGVERDTPLLLLLRKYVVGGRILAIEQPELERVLVFSIAKGLPRRNTHPGDEPAHEPGDDDAELATEPAIEAPLPGEVWRCELVAELMERRGNIVLVNDDNIIMQAVRHVTPQMSRRPVAPRQPYELPPRQEKRDPRTATPDGLRALLDQHNGADLAKTLVNSYRGLSPQAAREAVFRSLGSTSVRLASDMPWARLALAVRELWSAEWQPNLARDQAGQPVAFAPYLLTHYPQHEPQPTISAALDTFYAAHEQLSSHQQRRDALARALNEARERLDRTRDQLEGELEQVNQLEQLRWEGEMILGFLHAITPGQAELEVEGRKIALDPTLRPLDNAQERFKAYDKAKGALAHVPERLAATTARMAGIDETLALLALAEGYEQIEQIGREAVEHGYLRPPARKPPKQRRPAPLRVESSDGYPIYIGRSAGQNEQVTFTIGAADDLWLHARGIPGAHVIIKSGGREVPERTLLEAAALAAYYSTGREATAVEIDIAPRRVVRRIPHGPVGLVHYRAEQTLRVAPQLPTTTAPGTARAPQQQTE